MLGKGFAHRLCHGSELLQYVDNNNMPMHT